MDIGGHELQRLEAVFELVDHRGVHLGHLLEENAAGFVKFRAELVLIDIVVDLPLQAEHLVDIDVLAGGDGFDRLGEGAVVELVEEGFGLGGVFRGRIGLQLGQLLLRRFQHVQLGHQRLLRHDIADGGDLVVHRLGRPFVNLGLAVVNEFGDDGFCRFQHIQLGHIRFLRAR